MTGSDAREELFPGNVRETPNKTTFGKSEIIEKIVSSLINEAQIRKSKTLDVSKKDLVKVPDVLLDLTQLERLSLEGNSIRNLPNSFFQRLPNLSWLDLRNNQLQFLPSVYVARHQNLRNLLLQNNQLRTLPLELGFVKTLNGLNIHGNPLDFPPRDVIQQGTQIILHFLRDVILAKSEEVSKIPQSPVTKRQEVNSRLDKRSALARSKSEISSSSVNLDTDYPNVSAHCAAGDSTPSIRPVPRTRPVTFSCDHSKSGSRRDQSSDPRKVKSSIRHKSSQSSSAEVQSPSFEYVTFKMAEERKVAKQRDYKVKENAILQRRRDELFLKDWREETKQQQQRKNAEVERIRKESDSSKLDTLKCRSPPYGQDKEHMRILSSDERIKENMRLTHERLKEWKDQQARKKASEDDKINRIYDLERRLKSHTQKMFERRKGPQASAKEELAAARSDLETAENLRVELMLQMNDLQGPV